MLTHFPKFRARFSDASCPSRGEIGFDIDKNDFANYRDCERNAWKETQRNKGNKVSMKRGIESELRFYVAQRKRKSRIASRQSRGCNEPISKKDKPEFWKIRRYTTIWGTPPRGGGGRNFTPRPPPRGVPFQARSSIFFFIFLQKIAYLRRVDKHIG